MVEVDHIVDQCHCFGRCASEEKRARPAANSRALTKICATLDDDKHSSSFDISLSTNIVESTRELAMKSIYFTKLFNLCQRTPLSQNTSKCRIHLSHRLEGAPHGEDPVKNFMDFKYPNQITTFEHYKLPQDLLDWEFNYPVCRDTMGIRWPGYWFKRKFVYVKEMEPEIVVPNLDGFELKPYVSYRTEDISTQPHTAKELFNSVYASQVERDFKEKNMENYEVSQEQIDEARLKAMQTGSDLFEDNPIDGVRAPVEYRVEC